MIYKNIVTGNFIKRPNRFIAHVMIDGKEEICHVKNTGRCKELLTADSKVVLQHFDSNSRKTKYDLISVYKNNRLINMDSQAPNKVVYEYLEKNFSDKFKIKPEYKFGNSRLDFFMENESEKILIEVKGCTLEENGVASFPDAPTERGRKHLEELSSAVKNGYKALIIFVIQMEDVSYFTPNTKNDPDFSEALLNAEKSGVNIVAFNCIVKENYLSLNNTVPVLLK